MAEHELHDAHGTDEAPNPGIRARLLDALSGAERYTLFADDIARAFEVSVASAREALRAIHEPSAWRAGALPGSRVLASPALAPHGVVIAELPLGLHIPAHAHTERELTFVLDGELSDHALLRYGPGALLDMQVGSVHAIAVTGEHACLAVFRRA